MNAAPFLQRSRAFVGLAVAMVATLLSMPATGQSPAKPPLKLSDTDIWNSESGTTLSRDGKWLAYIVTPPEGDAEVIIKGTTSNTEYRLARGGKSSGAAASRGPGRPGPVSSGLLAASPRFTPDGKAVFIPLTPTKADLDKAKAAKTKAADMPKTVLARIDLANGKVTERIEQVQSFNVYGEKAASYLIYKKEAKPENPPPAQAGAAVTGGASVPAPATGTPAPGSGTTPPERTRPGFGGRRGPPGATPPSGTPATTPTPRRDTGSELVIRNLKTGKERTLDSVTDFTVTKDTNLLVYVVAGKDDDKQGVYGLTLDSQAEPFTIKSGKGRYSRLTWDNKQARLAFFLTDSPPAPTPATPATRPAPTGGRRGPMAEAAENEPETPATAKLYVYLWEREAKEVARQPMGGVASTLVSATVATYAPAKELLGPETKGLMKGWSITDRGGINFSADGLKLSVATAKAPPERPNSPSNSNTPASDRIDLDIWHWKDEYIQPMQRVRGDPDRTRTIPAAYFFDSKTFRQVGEEDLSVSVPNYGDWSIGSNDKPYRYLTGYGPSLGDYSLVNIRSGEKQELFKAFTGFLSMSPKGKHVLIYDHKDWWTLKTPGGKKVNLTAKLPVKFFNEEWDTPSEPPPYGILGWTQDENFVLLYDQYDLWKIAADGSSATNLTKGRDQKIQYRRVRIGGESNEEDEEPGYDLSKPLLLKATNLHTRDTGFFRLEAGSAPKLLVMGARDYGNPVKARDADVLLMKISTFDSFPDYYASTPDFQEIRRVSDINPKTREFNWGTAELVHYRNIDGVPLSGILIKPSDFDPSKKYPMMVYIYERLSQNLHNFRLPTVGTSINPTFYASNGYLVFMPDIVYTIGSPGQSAMKCVLPAIDAVVGQGFVKEDAIGIQGHSWGGYQIAYMVTQTNRFKAAAAGAPVSNMVSAYGGIRWGTGLPREFQYERTQSRIGGTLWESTMKYIENSPVFMADRVNTPLLMLHNDQDDAVPWYQGIEYYLALRRLGKEVYMLNYNGEFHGLRKKATQQDYTLRMFHFFNHHLKGENMPEWMEKGVKYVDRDSEKEQWKDVYKPDRKEEEEK